MLNSKQETTITYKITEVNSAWNIHNKKKDWWIKHWFHKISQQIRKYKIVKHIQLLAVSIYRLSCLSCAFLITGSKCVGNLSKSYLTNHVGCFLYPLSICHGFCFLHNKCNLSYCGETTIQSWLTDISSNFSWDLFSVILMQDLEKEKQLHYFWFHHPCKKKKKGP